MFTAALGAYRAARSRQAGGKACLWAGTAYHAARSRQAGGKACLEAGAGGGASTACRAGAGGARKVDLPNRALGPHLAAYTQTFPTARTDQAARKTPITRLHTDLPAGPARRSRAINNAPSAGFEPALTVPETDALSPELRGLAERYYRLARRVRSSKTV